MSTEILQYPRHIHETATEWRLLISSGEITAKEREDFEVWRSSDPRHADAYDQAVTIWSALGKVDRSALEPSLFKRSKWLLVRKFLFTLPVRVFQQQHGMAMAAAALLAVVLSVGIVSQLLNNGVPSHVDVARVASFTTERGQTKLISLDDQTIVTLGAGTELEVIMTDSERRARLHKGAAVFDVEHDARRPFFVDADKFTAKVLGTVFDVRNNGGTVRLAVSEGRVEAMHPMMMDGRAFNFKIHRELEPGEQISASHDDGLAEVSEFQKENFAAWREGRLRYQAATLTELVADANRYSTRLIWLADDVSTISGEKVTVTFNSNNVERLLATLPTLFPVQIDSSGSGAIVVRAR